VPTDDDLLPKKKAPRVKPPSSGSSRTASRAMVRLMRIGRGVGIALGGAVSLLGMMAVVGLITDNFWARLIVALVVIVGLPAFLAERLLRRAPGEGLGLVGDVYALLLLGIALIFVSAEAVTKGVLVDEGDRYARSGSRTMARVAYFVAGVAPVFPEDAPPPAPSGAPAPAPTEER
jgi:hypothetical protein